MKFIDYLNLVADAATIIPAGIALFIFLYRRGLQPLSARRAKSLADKTSKILDNVSEMRKDSYSKSVHLNFSIICYIFGSCLIVISMIFSSTAILLIVQLRSTHSTDYIASATVVIYLIASISAEIIGLTNVSIVYNITFAARDPLSFLEKRLDILDNYVRKQKSLKLGLSDSITLLLNSISDANFVESDRVVVIYGRIVKLHDVATQKTHGV